MEIEMTEYLCMVATFIALSALAGFTLWIVWPLEAVRDD